MLAQGRGQEEDQEHRVGHHRPPSNWRLTRDSAMSSSEPVEKCPRLCMGQCPAGQCTCAQPTGTAMDTAASADGASLQPPAAAPFTVAVDHHNPLQPASQAVFTWPLAFGRQHPPRPPLRQNPWLLPWLLLLRQDPRPLLLGHTATPSPSRRSTPSVAIHTL